MTREVDGQTVGEGAVLDNNAVTAAVGQQRDGVAVLGRRDSIGQSGVCLRADLRHAGNHAVRAIGVSNRGVARGRECRARALGQVVGRIEAVERAAADADSGRSVLVVRVVAVDGEAAVAVATAQLPDVERAAIDSQRAVEDVRRTDVAGECAVLDGALARCVLQVNRVRVVLQRVNRAVARDGQVGFAPDGNKGPVIGVVVPDLFRIGDGLAVQVERDGALVLDNYRIVNNGVRQQRDRLAVLRRVDGLGQSGKVDSANGGDSLDRLQDDFVLRRIGGLPLERVSQLDLIAVRIRHGRAEGQRRLPFGNGVQRGSFVALGVAIRHKVKRICLRVRAKIQADILDRRIAFLRADVEAIVGDGDRAPDIPLGNVLELHGAGAGNGIAGEVDLGQGLEVVALTLVVARGPVAVGRPDPRGVGVVGADGISIIRKRAAVERQRLSRDSAHDDAVKRAAVELQLAQLTPRGGIQLVVEAHDVVEGNALERHIGVGGHRQQQGSTDVVNVGVAGSTAGDTAIDKHNALAIGAIVLLIQIAVLAVGVELGMIGVLTRGIIALAVAQYAVLVVDIVTHRDVHGAAQCFLCGGVLCAGHSTQLIQRVGAGLSATRFFLHAVGAVRVLGGDEAVSAQGRVHRGRERTAGNSDRLSGVVESRLLLRRGIPGVGLKSRIIALRREGTAGNGDLAKALVAGTVDNRNCRAVLDGTVALGLCNRVARHRNRATRVDIQVARAHLRAHRLRVDRGVVDGQRSAAGEVNAEAVGNVERAVLQNNGVVRVVAVRFDAARGGRSCLNAFKRKGGVVVRDSAAHSRRNQADELRAHDLAVFHRKRCVGVIDLERCGVRVSSRARPGMVVQVNHASNGSGVERATRGVVAQQGDGFAGCGLRLERFVHGVIAGFADLSKVSFCHAVRAVGVLSSSGAFNQIAGRIGAKRTARDLDRRLCGIVGSGTRAVVNRVQRAIDGTARDGHLRHFAFGAVVSHRLNLTVDGAAADR